MRILQGIVGCEAIALVVLLALAFAPGDVAPPRPVAGAVVTTTADATAAHGAVDTVATIAASTEPHSERVEAPAATADGTVVLHGALLGLDASAEPKPSILCRRGDTCRVAHIRDGVYVFADLSPGTWHLICVARGCAKQEFDHVLGPAPVQRLDLTLERAVVLPVRVRTSKGARLSEDFTLGPMHVIATDAPLSGDLDPTDDWFVGDIGIGRFFRTPHQQLREDRETVEGTLELDRAPPANAVLLVRHRVLAQQAIAIGQREVRFEVDAAVLGAIRGGARGRVIGTDGRPVEGAAIHLTSADRSGWAPHVADDGVWEADYLLPGIYELEVLAKCLEPYARHVLVPAGSVTEVGDIVLGQEKKVSVRVVDADGNGVGARVEPTAIDTWRPPCPLRKESFPVGDGNGELRLGARRYVVRAYDDRGRVGTAIVDARAASRPSVTITVAQPTEVRIDNGVSLATHVVVVRNTAGDVVDVVRAEPRRRDWALRLPRGEYRVEIHDGRGSLLRRMPLEVGAEPLRLEVP